MGRSRSTADRAADHLTPFSEPEARYRERDGLAADRRLGCHAQRAAATWWSTCPRSSQIHRQVVRKEADAHPIEVDPVVRLHYVEVEEPTLATTGGDLERLLVALERDWDLARARGRSRRAARAAADASGRAWTATVAVRDGSLDHGDMPGVPRRGARGGVRRGLDDGGRTPVRPAHGRRARERRRDEPADPVRRGPDEPGELRDDASGRRGGADRGGPRVPRRTGGRPLRAGRRRARRRARAHVVGNPIMHHLVLRARPDRARWRAVRAGHRRCAHRARLAT